LRPHIRQEFKPWPHTTGRWVVGALSAHFENYLRRERVLLNFLPPPPNHRPFRDQHPRSLTAKMSKRTKKVGISGKVCKIEPSKSNSSRENALTRATVRHKVCHEIFLTRLAYFLDENCARAALHRHQTDAALHSSPLGYGKQFAQRGTWKRARGMRMGLWKACCARLVHPANCRPSGSFRTLWSRRILVLRL
jgi:hypothetical protein